MSAAERAGKPAEPRDLVDVARVVSRYYTEHPDPEVAAQRVAFGTSGHRGSSLRAAFTEDHIAATSQAIVEYRRQQGTDGPLFLGRDTHALSEPAAVTALEVFAANEVTTLIDSRDGYTPTPALSHAILTYNRGRTGGLADGVVVTPSHNPPDDGGFKYNPPNGGPAGTDATTWIQDRANALIAGGLKEVRRIPAARARAAASVGGHDFLDAYVGDLPSVIDMDAIRRAGLRIPEDISVIGFDGLELGEFYTPKLTTIRQQASLLVDRGVALLLGTLERGAVARHETVPFTLAVRESTSHPPRKDGTNS